VTADEVFDPNSDYYTSPPVTPEAIAEAERLLGVKLPAAYLRLIRERNGGKLRRQSFLTPFPTSWAPDHIGVRAILGIGGSEGIDHELGSRYMVVEWGYPDIGVVFCETPAGGHDAVMLDYRECGAHGEPSVAYIDEDRIPRTIAASFEDFVAGLVDEPEPEDD